MSYCRNCGNQIDAAATFCTACGAQQVVVQPVQYQQVVYTKPKVPGRGLGISAMVVSIVGLLNALSMFMSAIAFTSLASSGVFEAMEEFGEMGEFSAADAIGTAASLSVLLGVIMYSSLSIMAIPFAKIAMKRGYINGISKSGMIMGVLGVCLYFFTVIISFACL